MSHESAARFVLFGGYVYSNKHGSECVLDSGDSVEDLREEVKRRLLLYFDSDSIEWAEILDTETLKWEAIRR